MRRKCCSPIQGEAHHQDRTGGVTSYVLGDACHQKSTEGFAALPSPLWADLPSAARRGPGRRTWGHPPRTAVVTWNPSFAASGLRRSSNSVARLNPSLCEASSWQSSPWSSSNTSQGSIPCHTHRPRMLRPHLVNDGTGQQPRKILNRQRQGGIFRLAMRILRPVFSRPIIARATRDLVSGIRAMAIAGRVLRRRPRVVQR